MLAVQTPPIHRQALLNVSISTMRVNLPEPDQEFPVATEVAKLLHRTGATQYIVVVYTGEEGVTA